jgi:enamidase
LRRFWVFSFLLVNIPSAAMLWLQYYSGGFRGLILAFLGWTLLVLLYWWPLGALLFWWKRGWVSRLFVGYLVSIPLYFLCMLLIYPLFGVRFHPRSAMFWGIYLAQTPTFYLMVLALFLLARGGKMVTRITTWAVSIVFAIGVIVPFAYAVSVDRYTWPNNTPQRVNIINAQIVDAGANRILPGKNVHIENGRIVAIVDSYGDRNDWPKIDAGGKYLVPGLIDVHTHLQSPIRSVLGSFDFGFFLESLFSAYAPQRRAYIESGVTAVRDTGGPAARAYSLRAELQSHGLLGPRLFVVGRLVTSPNGHPVSTIWTKQVSRQGAILATDSETLLSGLEQNYASGPPDAVKFVYGTIGRAKERLQPQLLEQGIAWAKSKNLITIVHAETTEEVSEAARAGATGIEHVASTETLPESLVSLLKTNGTFVDPTFGELETAMILRGDDAAQRETVLKERRQFMRQLTDAGIRLTVGTDAPLLAYGSGLHEELAQYVKAGFQPAEILTFVTINNATYLGKADALGKIAPGYAADLILVQGNPLQDISSLRKPAWVMLEGQIVAPKLPR